MRASESPAVSLGSALTPEQLAGLYAVDSVHVVNERGTSPREWGKGSKLLAFLTKVP
jgi:hypothetical protein